MPTMADMMHPPRPKDLSPLSAPRSKPKLKLLCTLHKHWRILLTKARGVLNQFPKCSRKVSLKLGSPRDKTEQVRIENVQIQRLATVAPLAHW